MAVRDHSQVTSRQFVFVPIDENEGIEGRTLIWCDFCVCMWVSVHRQLWSASKKGDNERVNKSKARASACTLSFVYVFFLILFYVQTIAFRTRLRLSAYRCDWLRDPCADISIVVSVNVNVSVQYTLQSSSLLNTQLKMQSAYVEWLLAGSSSASSIVFTHTHWLQNFILNFRQRRHIARCVPNGIVMSIHANQPENKYNAND